jgi:hypothetical protein
MTSEIVHKRLLNHANHVIITIKGNGKYYHLVKKQVIALQSTAKKIRWIAQILIRTAISAILKSVL